MNIDDAIRLSYTDNSFDWGVLTSYFFTYNNDDTALFEADVINDDEFSDLTIDDLIEMMEKNNLYMTYHDNMWFVGYITRFMVTDADLHEALVKLYKKVQEIS